MKSPIYRLRFPPHERLRVEKGAKRTGKSLARFMIEASLEEAARLEEVTNELPKKKP